MGPLGSLVPNLRHENVFLCTCNCLSYLFQEITPHIQDTFNRSLILASGKKKPHQPNMSPHSFTVSQLRFSSQMKKSHINHHSFFPFPNHTVLQNLQSNNKNWQTWRYLQHYELLLCLRDLNIWEKHVFHSLRMWRWHYFKRKDNATVDRSLN